MNAYRFTGFLPAHYDTPTGSRYVEPDETVDWDMPPDIHWAAVEATAVETPAESEPEPAPPKAAPTTKE